jgi:hypothetical protein
VTSPKTKRHNKPWRVVPLFPELLPYLEDAHEQAADGAEFVITRYRSANSNLRTQFERILRKAGLEPWPRLFQNLRASREIELANQFPLHVVTSWLGNTPKVADKHYLQVTPEHMAEAVRGGAGGGAAGCRNGVQVHHFEHHPSQENPRKGSISGVFGTSEAPPVGLEDNPSTLELHGDYSSVAL